MKVCPTLHGPEDLDSGFFICPVPRPLYLHDPPRPSLDGFNGSQRPGYNPRYQWGDDEHKIGHDGPDLGVRRGDPVAAMADGTVWYRSDNANSSAGVQLAIIHKCPECGGWFLTRYLHLLPGSVLVKVGASVRQGQQIARGSDSGINVNWTHVHCELLHDPNPNADKNKVYPGAFGVPYDPLAWGILDSSPPPQPPAPPPGAFPFPTLRLYDGYSTRGRPQYNELVAKIQGALAVEGLIDLEKFIFDYDTVRFGGQYGPLTKAAVERFQRRAGLPVTGEVDPATWTALFGR